MLVTVVLFSKLENSKYYNKCNDIEIACRSKTTYIIFIINVFLLRLFRAEAELRIVNQIGCYVIVALVIAWMFA